MFEIDIDVAISVNYDTFCKIFKIPGKKLTVGIFEVES